MVWDFDVKVLIFARALEEWPGGVRRKSKRKKSGDKKKIRRVFGSSKRSSIFAVRFAKKLAGMGNRIKSEKCSLEK